MFFIIEVPFFLVTIIKHALFENRISSCLDQFDSVGTAVCYNMVNQSSIKSFATNPCVERST